MPDAEAVLTLPDFLKARYDEEADLDWHVFDCSGMPHGPEMTEPCCDAQARLPLEVAAKRKVLALLAAIVGGRTLTELRRDAGFWRGSADLNESALADYAVMAGEALAAMGEPFAGHPEYREEWKL